eukprot:TRINITY_DN1491_c0_g1_i1.p1 TRINITY_DN1491_c0_g1~~TRINITY_DN1491_c0_g1_i1.p1  ORF type:complete len:141 (+),score=48.48 TRINITY_DN1491_c0_g1_i1:152-574(+)
MPMANTSTLGCESKLPSTHTFSTNTFQSESLTTCISNLNLSKSTNKRKSSEEQEKQFLQKRIAIENINDINNINNNNNNNNINNSLISLKQDNLKQNPIYSLNKSDNSNILSNSIQTTSTTLISHYNSNSNSNSYFKVFI